MITIQPITPVQTYPLRHAVLWPDKPLDYVKIDTDDEGHHYGAFREDELVAVISLFVDQRDTRPTEARFRKFATRSDCQRTGIGTRLLSHVIAEARRMNATRLWCDARLDAADFYKRFGMEPVSEVFYKGPIPYAKFSLTLT
ncbi:GNAT family N-acetyltransferase [Spirosoma utsteinense]|uniref:GNAT family N-acyltransferase n=1 Tax=Spirosoma utsteinense TaxID=2585773 RepID=A0ABR6W157_9BACT|nr:GNAT family N-acetyltransferase [Spirosoma utsteinense]MBC3784620.1 putative GNAT family N-acyltransferase [Spirosoma utsteinense]MBC3789627.1 putative GNAT family N-acyltransferase [Spirosoma utsteinense]